jgi:hypothetical protein
MSWFLRGVQSAVFHYASCAPCTGYTEARKRRRAAKRARKVKEKLQLEHPEAYHHPEPTGTNPYWGEEIRVGPGPPPRRARRTNTAGSRALTTAGTQSSIASKAGSSVEGERTHFLGLSDDTVEDDNWNRKRYQREDEDLWGIDEPPIPLQHVSSSSSGGHTTFSLKRPGTVRIPSYYSGRAPPVNELHPPVVSLPSPDPSENRWMLQPPPKASVMAGKERATNRSRSGSGASSRVELSLQRQLSTKQVMHKLDRGETPELPSISRNSSSRPPSAGSSRHEKKRRDTALTTFTSSTRHSSGESTETIVKSASAPHSAGNPDIKVIRVRQSRPALSTVVSSGSGPDPSDLSYPFPSTTTDENSSHLEVPDTGFTHRRNFTYSTQSSDSMPYLLKPRAPLSSSDVSSLNCLQDLVSPRDLLKSRFVSAPLVEAKIRLPPSDTEEARTLSQKASWAGSGFKISREKWESDGSVEPVRVPFDGRGAPVRDPRLRWSVDF